MIVKMLEILGRSESSSGLFWLLFVSFYKVNVITAALYEPLTQIRLSIKIKKNGNATETAQNRSTHRSPVKTISQTDVKPLNSANTTVQCCG